MPTLRRSSRVLLGLSVVWCLSWSVIIMSRMDWEREELDTRRQPGQVQSETSKTQAKDKLITELQPEKVPPQPQVVPQLEELKNQEEKEEKKDKQEIRGKKGFIYMTDTDEKCPLPPLDGFPQCEEKVEWMKTGWKSDVCYSRHGVNGSICSIIIYLSETEGWCPRLPGRLNHKAQTQSEEAVVREHLTDLYPALETRVQLKWIHQRIQSMEEIWVEAGRSLSAKYNLRGRQAKHILVHPGAMTDESGFKIARAAFSGGPLGELVQWSDLIATLHILGHHLQLSASIPDLRNFLGRGSGRCPHTNSTREATLIYTDIIGLKQMRLELNTSWDEYKCMVRVLDSFGTEPDFNHPVWAKEHNLLSVFGGLNMIPAQFYTMFPHTPDNTFLGFVVQNQLSSKLTEELRATKRRNQALVYGKRATFWQGREAYVGLIHKYLEVHGTVDLDSTIPRYVKNHGIIKGTEVQALLRQSKVFVGLSFPFEGPAPLEALANGCVFLNPRINPPQSRLNSKFFHDKPTIREVTSQHPYAEAIGEPYVFTIDVTDEAEVERTLLTILNQTVEPYLPHEFSCEGMLQRVNVLVEKQHFCRRGGTPGGPGGGTPGGPPVAWPPLSALQVVRAQAGASCKQACRSAGLICEPAFFPQINTVQGLDKVGVSCESWAESWSQLVFPSVGPRGHCELQADPLLFSCVRSNSSVTRVCPCRDFIRDQVALCRSCL